MLIVPEYSYDVLNTTDVRSRVDIDEFIANVDKINIKQNHQS